MIPLFNQAQRHPNKTITQLSLPLKTLLNQHLSTSPRSYQSPQSSHPRPPGPASSLQSIAIQAQQSASAIEVSIYGRQYLVQEWKGEECQSKLEEMMKDGTLTRQTKISIKLIVAKKLSQIDFKYEAFLRKTVSQYQILKQELH